MASFSVVNNIAAANAQANLATTNIGLNKRSDIEGVITAPRLADVGARRASRPFRARQLQTRSPRRSSRTLHGDARRRRAA